MCFTCIISICTYGKIDELHVHSPCVWACWSDPSRSPVGPDRWRTGLSGPEPGWRRCVPVKAWRHRCGGSGSLPGSTVLQTEAGRPPEASGAPGCTGPCIKAQLAPLVPRLRGERERGGDADRVRAGSEHLLTSWNFRNTSTDGEANRTNLHGDNQIREKR